MAGLSSWHEAMSTVVKHDTSGKESTCQCRRSKSCRFSPWVRKSPWNRKWQPTPVFLLRKFHGQRSLVGYSPWGRKESDTTGHIQHTHTQWVRFGFSSQWTQHFREICSESWPISLFAEVWWANSCKTVLKTSCSDIKNLALILYTLCYKIQFALQYIINVHNKWLSDSYWIRAWRYFSWSQILGDYFKVRRREKSHITLLKTGY